jgi:hypothetical protein
MRKSPISSMGVLHHATSAADSYSGAGTVNCVPVRGWLAGFAGADSAQTETVNIEEHIPGRTGLV